MRAHHFRGAGTIVAVLLAAVACADGASADNGASKQAPVSRQAVPATATVSGIPVAEISGLAWDSDSRQLQAVSDQGYVYRFRIRYGNGELTSVEPVFAARLTDPATGMDSPGAHENFNAEGLALRRSADGGTALLVALEGNPPQIAVFDLQGRLQERIPVPPPANDIDRYQKKGRGLETVDWHPSYGVLTAPEAPLQSSDQTLHTVYANGHAWSFPRHDAESRLKALAVLPDGNLLVLERSRASARKARIASIRRVDITACDAGRVCRTTLLATLPPGPENFEGMALLDARHVLVASDNGGDTAHDTTFALVTLP